MTVSARPDVMWNDVAQESQIAEDQAIWRQSVNDIEIDYESTYNNGKSKQAITAVRVLYDAMDGAAPDSLQ